MLFYIALAVAGIVLIITKSEILACKRDYVIQRYEASKINSSNFLIRSIHRWWHAMWTCSMCCGCWIALVYCLNFHIYGFWIDWPAIFFLNWLLHSIEDYLVKQNRPDN